MRMRRLGGSGLFVSELAFGAMTFGGTDGLWGQVGQLGQEEADAVVGAALDAGINLFDTANVYAHGRSEEILGQSLRNLGVPRDQVVIATKVGSAMGAGPNDRGASRRHILAQCRASLARLRLGHVDLYQIHAFDPATPMEETLEALDTLVRAGDVRYVGLSNWAAWQVMKAIGLTEARRLAPITSLQAYYSLVGRDVEREIVPLLASERVGLMVWSPLAGGYLTGKYSGADEGDGGRQTTLDFPPIDRVRGEPLIEVLRAVARKHGCLPAQIAIAWLLRQPAVSTVLIGAKRVEQLHANVRAAAIVLEEEDLAELDTASHLPSEYPGWLLRA
ncbi:aryl-alcohol dehydrogenase-like predicted oxidoreductase [Ancylobacter aquaticus]|uniref:Aryl-alcohol dehydrogenase-like predicted oxidoreductase n=1 Tax=Ancylobacter aquaticus TaxID=100 RepID=A0A4R1I5X1_ANCAQ|nr:aldo/keto reductase [Ancylobacter aquaticus]TCK30754.1 aryl-alcohol dehydrogenase-like predicted oxidoreductase [Ancylobacter aquaticus]